jgi:Tfp pilus assembly protein PilV
MNDTTVSAALTQIRTGSTLKGSYTSSECDCPTFSREAQTQHSRWHVREAPQADDSDHVPCRRLRRRHQAGASLIEIIIATLIVAILAIGLVEFFAKGRVGFDREERKRVATLLAQESMERTIAKGYTTIASWNETRRVSSVSYSVAVTVQSNTPETNIKTVRSTVTWQATPTAQRSVSLATLVFNN